VRGYREILGLLTISSKAFGNQAVSLCIGSAERDVRLPAAIRSFQIGGEGSSAVRSKCLVHRPARLA